LRHRTCCIYLRPERQDHHWKIDRCRSIHLDSLGIINGQIDFDILATSYPDKTFHYTYAVQAISEEAYLSAKANATTWLELIQKSRALADICDPGNMGINATVNSVCSAAYGWCYSTSKLRTWVRGKPPFATFENSSLTRVQHDAFDVGHTTPDPSYIGGVVRQFDNLSFSLVFDAAYGALPHLLSFASCG
jgi:carboxypeptidase D